MQKHIKRQSTYTKFGAQEWHFANGLQTHIVQKYAKL